MFHNVTNVWSARRRSTMMWSIEWESFFLALSRSSWILSPNPSDWSRWIFDQRCSVNLIMRCIPLRIVLLQEFSIDRHPDRIIIQSYKAVYSIWVDWLYYKWSFPFGLNFFSSYVSYPRVFWQLRQCCLSWKSILWLSNWKLWKSELDRAWFVVELADVGRPKILTPGVAIDASPRLSSPSLKQ